MLRPLGKRIENVKAAIITHSHMDHIMELPSLIDILVWSLGKELKVMASTKTISSLKDYIFNNSIWPELSENVLKFEAVNSPFEMEGVEFIPVKSDHTVETFGFLINRKIYVTSDTKENENLWKTVEEFRPEVIVIDVSWPARLSHLVPITRHFSTKEFGNFVKKLKYIYRPKIYTYHHKPAFFEETTREIEKIAKDTGMDIEIASPGIVL